jgi:ABC-type transport system involved in cytochrome c biogenesis permease subunit
MRRSSSGRHAALPGLSAAMALGVAYGLVFFYAPEDADQGFVQKIFYLHVPMAIVARSASWRAACWASRIRLR